MRITKPEAAHRQLETAIQLLFEDGDPVVAHTLVGAASAIFSDLARHANPSTSWDTMASESNRLSRKEYFRIMREAQNFLKHADEDPNGVLELDPEATDALTFGAIYNASELGELSVHESVFQAWYLAFAYPEEEKQSFPFREAIEMFGDLNKVDRLTRLEVGRRVLEQELARAK